VVVMEVAVEVEEAEEEEAGGVVTSVEEDEAEVVAVVGAEAEEEAVILAALVEEVATMVVEALVVEEETVFEVPEGEVQIATHEETFNNRHEVTSRMKAARAHRAAGVVLTVTTRIVVKVLAGTIINNLTIKEEHTVEDREEETTTITVNKTPITGATIGTELHVNFWSEDYPGPKKSSGRARRVAFSFMKIQSLHIQKVDDYHPAKTDHLSPSPKMKITVCDHALVTNMVDLSKQILQVCADFLLDKLHSRDIVSGTS